MASDLSFEEFYEREFRSVAGAVLIVCRDRSIAEEATQEAFARAFARWGRLRQHPWAPGWVATTALNYAKRLLRAQRRTYALAAHEGSAYPDLDVWRALRALPPRQREAALLHYVMDMRVNDVAAAMKCSPGAVKAHLSRARTALARSLAPQEGA